VDINNLLGKLLDSGFAGGVAGGMASSLVTSKSGRKLGKSALKVGGVAAVGALAYSAYQRYAQSQSPATAPPVQQSPAHAAASAPPPPPHGSAFLPALDDHQGQHDLGLILIRAMIAAARSDGRLDAQESQLIFQKITDAGLDNATQNQLIQEMGQPVDIDAIVNSASSQEVAAEIYLASLLAIEVDTPQEHAYLGMLAARLMLPPELVHALQEQVAQQKQALS